MAYRKPVLVGSMILLAAFLIAAASTHGSSASARWKKTGPQAPDLTINPNEIDDGGGGGGEGEGGGGGLTVRTRYLDYSVPGWGVSKRVRAVLVSGANGLERVDVYDINNVLIHSITRAQHDAWSSAGGVPPLPSASQSRSRDARGRSPRTSPLSAVGEPIPAPPLVVRTGTERPIPASMPFLDSYTAGDSALTIVGSVHN